MTIVQHASTKALISVLAPAAAYRIAHVYRHRRQEPPKNDSTVTFAEHVRFMMGHMWPDDQASRLNLLTTIVALGIHKFVAFTPASALGNLATSVTEMSKKSTPVVSPHVKGHRKIDPHQQRMLRSLLNALSRQDSPRIQAMMDVGSYLGAQCVKVVANEMKSGAFARVIGHATYNANMQGFEAIQNSALDDVLKNRSAELIARVDQGTAAVGSTMNNVVLRCIPTFLDLALFQRRLKKQGVDRARQLMYGTLGTYFLWTMGYSHLRVRYRLHNATAIGSHKGVLQESLANAETVKLLGTEQEEASKFSRVTTGMTETRDKVATSLSLLNAGQQLILAVGTTTALAQSVRRVYEGKADVGEVVALGHMFHHITHPLNFLGTMYREFRTNYVAVNELISLIKRQPAVEEKPGARPLEINKGSIAIKNLSFAYPSQDSVALDNVSIRVLGGSSIAIVGPSGSGKSTLVKLIARLYDPQQGSIEICGQNVKDVTLKSLKDSIAFVPQETILFNDTLRYNILYGAPPNTTQEDFQEALKAAQLDILISNLSEGLDTNVGERGSRLSGGERQRVALARCFLRKPRIVILDEATSNLDAHTEKQISIAMKELQKGRTSITVAHRLSSITDVDNIIYLENGKVVETGNHRELLERKGKYADLWKDQQTRGVPAFEQRRREIRQVAIATPDCCPTGCNH